MADRLQTVATFSNLIVANMARNKLESAGIKAFLNDQEMAGGLWHLSGALGGVKLQVAESDAERAVDVLEQSGDDAAATSRHEDDPRSEQSALDEYSGGDPHADDSDDDDEIEFTPREQNADRVFRGSIVGVLFLPVQFFVLWLLLKILLSSERLSPAHRSRAVMGAWICVVSTSLWIFALGRPFFGR
jgi:hypothetical protein